MGGITKNDASEHLVSFKKKINKISESRNRIIEKMRKSEQPDEFVPDLSKFNTQYNYCFALIKNLKRLLDLYSSVEEMEKKRYPTNTYKRKIEDLSKRITKAFAREKV